MDMRAGQERHCDGKKAGNEPHRRRGLRKFTEAHVAFLNAAYSACDYLRQSVTRQHLHEVKGLLDDPNVRFHRQLRNTVDHTERPEYAVTFEIHQMIALKTPETFPHVDLRIAMAKGLVAIETEPARLGKGHLTYDRNSLDVDDARRLDAAVAALAIKENPSVIYMAECCYERILAFAIMANDRGAFRNN
jgi:5-formyltetrahydrofolate cyclo-ligase